MNQKAQEYLIACTILAALVYGLGIMASQSKIEITKTNTGIIENIAQEMTIGYQKGYLTNDINGELNEIANWFLTKTTGMANTLTMCFVAEEENGDYLIGNYSKQIQYYENENITQQEILPNTTINIAKATLLNDINLTLCNYNFPLEKEMELYIKLEYSGGTQIWTNVE